MIYSQEVEMMCPVAQGANHGPAPIPEELNGGRLRKNRKNVAKKRMNICHSTK